MINFSLKNMRHSTVRQIKSLFFLKLNKGDNVNYLIQFINKLLVLIKNILSKKVELTHFD